MSHFATIKWNNILVIFLFVSFVYSKAVVVSSEDGKDEPGCGTPQEPCATLQYVFDPAKFDLQSGDAVQIDGSGDPYDITGIQVTQNNLLIMSNTPPQPPVLTIEDTQGITIRSDGVTFQGITFKDINIPENASVIDINANGAEITFTQCVFQNINAQYLIQGDQGLEFINLVLLSADDVTVASLVHSNTQKFILDGGMISNSNFTGSAINIVSSDILITEIQVSTTSFHTGLCLISTDHDSLEESQNVTISSINVNNIETQYPLINIGINEENTFVNIDSIFLVNTIGPIIVLASEQHYGTINIDTLLVSQANLNSTTPTWLINVMDTNSFVLTNVNIQNSIANFIYSDKLVNGVVENTVITGSWQRERLFSSLLYFTNCVDISLDNVTLSENDNLEGDLQFNNVENVSINQLNLLNNEFNQEGAILLLQNTVTTVIQESEFSNNLNEATISVVRSNYEFIASTTVENTILDTIYFDCASNSTLILKSNTYGENYCNSVKATPDYLETDAVCKVSGTDVVPCGETSTSTSTQAWYAVVMIVVYGLIGLTVFTVIIVSAIYFITKRRQSFSTV